MSKFKRKNAQKKIKCSITSSLNKLNNKLQVIPTSSAEEKYKKQKVNYGCLNNDKTFNRDLKKRNAMHSQYWDTV